MLTQFGNFCREAECGEAMHTGSDTDFGLAAHGVPVELLILVEERVKNGVDAMWFTGVK